MKRNNGIKIGFGSGTLGILPEKSEIHVVFVFNAVVNYGQEGMVTGH